MERSQLCDLMGELQLNGMKAAFDEIMATAVKRQHEPQRIIGDLLTAEINEKQARTPVNFAAVLDGPPDASSDFDTPERMRLDAGGPANTRAYPSVVESEGIHNV
jgi:hypothetical protein